MITEFGSTGIDSPIENVTQLIEISAVPLPAAAWMALSLLGVMGVISKMRRRR